MKKICFVTSTRAEYGSLKWLMMDITKSKHFKLQLIVTGGHLMQSQGHTIDEIIEDGLYIDECVDANINTTSTEAIAESMGRLAQMFSHTFSRLAPDYVVVLGDRYELLPIVNSAFVMRIPIIHISGGDVTEGAIDDGIRNAITMLADYHFPSTVDSANNITRMIGSRKNVWAVGEPELDAINRKRLWTRKELAEDIGLDVDRKWGLMTYHAETVKSVDYNLNAVKILLKALERLEEIQVVATFSNADFGGDKINEILKEAGKKRPDRLIIIPSLGHHRYLSFMKQVKFVIGNSSSGITQAPMLEIPSINIGERQKGRYQCSSVIQCDVEYGEICNAIDKALVKKADGADLGYWGDGHASEKIIKIFEQYLS